MEWELGGRNVIFGARIGLQESPSRLLWLSVLNYRTRFNFYLFLEALNYMLCFEQLQGTDIVNYGNTLQDCGVYYQEGVPSELELLWTDLCMNTNNH